MNGIAPFVVILARPDGREPVVLAKALAAARKTPLQDQMMAAKNGWGILAENLSETDAQNLVQALQASAVERAAIPATSLVQLPEAKPAVTRDSIPTPQLVLVAAAAFTITSTTTKSVKEGPSAAQKVLSTAILLGTGLPIKIGGKERTVEKTQQHSDLVFYLDLLYKEPPATQQGGRSPDVWRPSRRLRVDALRFNYAFLNERKLYQVLGNFKLLVGDLVKAAPEAWQNHGTRILMENKPPATSAGGRSPDAWRSIQTMGYRSLADLERETRWLLTLQTLRS
jgi:hypothetical protein